MQFDFKKFSHPCMVIVVFEIKDLSTAVSYCRATFRGWIGLFLLQKWGKRGTWTGEGVRKQLGLVFGFRDFRDPGTNISCPKRPTRCVFVPFISIWRHSEVQPKKSCGLRSWMLWQLSRSSVTICIAFLLPLPYLWLIADRTVKFRFNNIAGLLLKLLTLFGRLRIEST